jgi:tRNA pseudouridine55 synthase
MQDQEKETTKQSYLDGRVLLIDKPYQWTSFDVVNKIRSLLRYRLGMKKLKVGHAGTLDPLATGLLIVCTGRATRKIESFQGLDKTYTGTFFIGKTTPSYDLEKAPDKDFPVAHITDELLKAKALSLSGEQKQVPPLFSAKKIAGERAYTHARAGLDTRLEANTINIKAFDITRIEMPEVDFRVVCSKGTYIRALARDFGEKLGSGAYLSALRRTHIGDHSIDDAINIKELQV